MHDAHGVKRNRSIKSPGAVSSSAVRSSITNTTPSCLAAPSSTARRRRDRTLVQHLERAHEIETAFASLPTDRWRRTLQSERYLARPRGPRVAGPPRSTPRRCRCRRPAATETRSPDRDGRPALAASDFGCFGVVLLEALHETGDRGQPFAGQQVRECGTIERRLQVVDLVRREWHATPIAERLSQRRIHGAIDAGSPANAPTKARLSSSSRAIVLGGQRVAGASPRRRRSPRRGSPATDCCSSHSRA